MIVLFRLFSTFANLIFKKTELCRSPENVRIKL